MNNREPSPESIARKKKYGKRYGHKKDKKLVTFYVKENVLDRWDEFCENLGVNRTTLIIRAVNEFIRKHKMEDLKETQLHDLQKKLDDQSKMLGELYDKLANDEEQKADLVLDGEVRGRILEYLEDVNATSKKISHVLKIDRELVIRVLGELKKDKLVNPPNKKGEWSVKK